MSKRSLILGAALLVLAMLAGCSILTRTNVDFDTDSISKAQKIVVADAAGNEKAVLTEEADIDAFVDAMNVGRWKFKEPPEDLTEAGSFTLWQKETVTGLAGEGKGKETELCTFRIYENGDYLTIETALIDVPFSIPKETADYLRNLTA